MENHIRIGKGTIGIGKPCYIIAEAGVNHNGDVGIALDLVRQAKKTGADCVKFQTYKTERIVTSASPKASYQMKVTDPVESQFEMLKKLELGLDDYKEIIQLCREIEIQFLSTPYNKEDADFLDELGVDAFKIASGQLVELPFLAYVARKRKPMLISTGMADLAEVYEAVDAIRAAGNDQIVVLQCTTNYPSAIGDANIRAMVSMQQALQVIVGYSDHVSNNYACYAAVALGAAVVEKHFTLDKTMPGPDHSSSLNPDEFSQLVDGIKNVEASLGSPIKKPTPEEVKNTLGMRRSIVAIEDLPQGIVLEEKHLGFKRPASGLPPKMQHLILGKQTLREIKKDSPISWESLQW